MTLRKRSLRAVAKFGSSSSATDDVPVGRAGIERAFVDRLESKQEALQVHVAVDPRIFLELAVVGGHFVRPVVVEIPANAADDLECVAPGPILAVPEVEIVSCRR